MPCGYHFGHHYGYGPFPGYPCPHCGYHHPPGYGPPWQQAWTARGFGYGPPPGWMPPGYGPAPAPPMRDEDIRRMATECLRADPRIPPQARIEVEVKEGTVTLTGSVPDKWVKRVANEIILPLPGVVDVQNNLQVARPAGRGPEAGSTQ